MSVLEASDGGAPYFRVTLAQGLYDNCLYDRNVQVAGLVAACGKLPLSSMRTGGEKAEHPIAMQLLTLLEDADVPLWTDSEFDPALAATAIEAFYDTARKDDE